MKSNDWKDRLHIVYSTNPDFAYEASTEEEMPLPSPQQQRLRIELDKRHRKGKSVTLITGYIGSDESLSELAKRLKSKLGVGGSARAGEILLQGDWRIKCSDLLTQEGHICKVIK